MVAPNDPQFPVRLSLRIVVYQEGKYWFAHCLDMDIVAEGESATSALADLLRLMAFQIEVACEEAKFTGLFNAAPPEIWELFSRGSDIDLSMPLPPLVQSLEAREVAIA